ncbi:amidase domain-containing protein [Streptomyces sp. T-3]|nr:amidase domain-containing protein [Streptomyces sp. T-3]
MPEAISYSMMISARPRMWKKAADEWQALAEQALQSSKDLRDYGAKPLKENWTDEVGQQAAADFEKLSNELEVAYDILLAVNMVADGMVTTIETAFSTATEAQELATRYGLTIGDDGTVTAPQPGSRIEAEEMGPYRQQVQALVDQALEQVREADDMARYQFSRLAKRTTLTDPEEALNDLQTQASNTQLDMLAANIPVGESPATVRAWWNGLSEKQRHDMMLAQPVALSKLDGIPEDTKREIRGTDGKFDRAKMVEYALNNWNAGDPTDMGSNCTNFVSNALHHAGMQEKTSAWGTTDDDSWMVGNPSGLDVLDRRLAYSDNWTAAENNQNFMLKHGGEEVPQSQARPGDIVYYEHSETASGEAGNTHHAAIVTAVMPDGEIKLTQHTDSYKNVSLDGRLTASEKNQGDQNIRIVRPHPDWY